MDVVAAVPAVSPSKQLHHFPNRQFRKTLSREGAPILKPYRRYVSWLSWGRLLVVMERLYDLVMLVFTSS